MLVQISLGILHVLAPVYIRIIYATDHKIILALTSKQKPETYDLGYRNINTENY